MARRKERLGFETPSAALEDDFAKVLRTLSGKKEEWDWLRNESLSLLNSAVEAEKEVVKVGAKPLDPVAAISRTGNLAAIQICIAALGIAISETHERLSKVEKAIEQLSHRTK